MMATHTYALLAVSRAAYDEIKAKLLAADYGHAINEKGEIDMHGITLIDERTIIGERRGNRLDG